MKRVAAAAALLCATLLVRDARALDEAACCLASTSQLDDLLNPVTGGDEKFFATPGGPPNVLLLLDNSGSMLWWPRDLPAGNNDCTDSYLNSVGYSDAALNQPEWKNVNSETFYTEWFNVNKVYEVKNAVCNDPTHLCGDYGSALNGAPSALSWGNGASRATAINSACAAATDSLRCQGCLASRGYYLDAVAARSRMVGNFLNLYSPRYLLARRVTKQVVKAIRPVRMSLFTLNPGEPTRVRDFNPPCNLSDPRTNNSSFDSNRQSFIQDLGNVVTSGGTPLTRALYAAGHSFATGGGGIYPAVFGPSWASAMGFTAASLNGYQEGGGANQKAICFSCAFSAIILLTDGEPSGAFENSVPAPVGDPAHQLAWDDCPECAHSDLDELAKFLWSADVRTDLDGKQRVATYAVGFGMDPTGWAPRLLRHTAEVGGGSFYSAYNATQLRESLLEIFDNIDSRNTSFSSASVATLQAGGSELSALVPRFSPQKSRNWTGELYRFRLFNEFVEDREHPQDGDLPGKPGYKSDIFLTDHSGADGDIVVEDIDGRFVKKGSITAAVPFWEARTRLLANGWASRKIYTVLDSSGPTGAKDGALTHHDPLVEFTTDNAALLVDYLGLKGTDRCPSGTLGGQEGQILSGLGLSVFDAKSITGYDLDPLVDTGRINCAKLLIEYLRGRDLADDDNDLDRDETRLSVLGDIFHSSPVVVDPPVDKFICRFGLHNQCLLTLFEAPGGSPATATPLAKYDETDCKNSPVTRDAYDSWAWSQRKRTKLVLVGANDGMLHAFADSAATESCDANGLSTISYDTGTGDEAWAFIPPDQLARLALLAKGHTFFVDGDLMVRDVWADEPTGSVGTKERGEYHTLAVVAEGRGGTHYFALEMLYDANGAPLAPGFRWMYPQPCTEEASLFGKTLYALGPKPPPIGPVLLDASSLSQPGQENYGTQTLERWMVMLSGGWSPGMEKGRGIYMVDAWSGLVNGRHDNLWWKWDKAAHETEGSGESGMGEDAEEHHEEESHVVSTEQQASRRNLTHSIVAPVALVDYGSNDTPQQDGYFDTAVVGDTGGQLWLARFFKPGVFDSGHKLIGNWSAARTFEQNRAGLSGTSGGDDAEGSVTKSAKSEWPFHFLASTAIFPDDKSLHAYLGTGNRYSVLDEEAGVCRYDNPVVCAKYGCGHVQTSYSISKRTLSLSQSSTQWESGALRSGDLQSSGTSLSSCGAPGTAAVTARLTASAVSTCPGGVSYGDLRPAQVDCGQDASGNFRCLRVDSNAMQLGDLNFAHSTTGLGLNRYYGIWAYGQRPDRVFDETLAATAPGKLTARGFDAVRLTDRSSTNATAGDLVDVTATTCDLTGKCTGNQATSQSNGWFFEYPALAHKTASGSAILASCALWNTMRPESSVTDCGVKLTPWSRFTQADIFSGAPSCAYSFRNTATGTWDRYQERRVLAPPPEPAAAIQISKSGAMKYSALVLEPGKDQATEVSVTGGQDRLQSVYELPVSRSLHLCRHQGPEYCTPDSF